VCAYENRVGGDTEGVFNDDFYEGLTGGWFYFLMDLFIYVCGWIDSPDLALSFGYLYIHTISVSIYI
jgi:hypothetical protein